MNDIKTTSKTLNAKQISNLASEIKLKRNLEISDLKKYLCHGWSCSTALAAKPQKYRTDFSTVRVSYWHVSRNIAIIVIPGDYL